MNRLWLRLLVAQCRAHPARVIAMALTMALGVALVAAVYLVNDAALAEFDRAGRRLAGNADLIVRGSRAGFDESWYPRLARVPGVERASAVLELDAALAARPQRLHIVAVDPFRAGAMQPALLGEIAGAFREWFEPGGVFVSAAAARELGVARGGRIEVLSGGERRSLIVLGVLSEAAYPQPLALMDIATAQDLFGRGGVLNRIDLGARPGVAVRALQADIEQQLPSGMFAYAPEIESARLASATRAYRVNLNMLALVSLLTGACLLGSTQSLSILRRRTSLALLRALGVTRRELARALLLEGVVVGFAGSVLGVALGYAGAAFVLDRLGADFGGGALEGLRVAPAWRPVAAVLAILGGTAFAAVAAWLPARAAAHRPPARALRAGDAEAGGPPSSRLAALGALLLPAGAVLALAPPVGGVPVFGYAAVAALLAGGVLLVPALAGRALARAPTLRRAPLDVALAQLRGASGQVSVGLAAVIVSFSLMVAMAIMVHSFRDSFVRWLGTVVPADLQVRFPPGSDSASLSAATQASIAALDGVERAEFRRVRDVRIDVERMPIALIARDIEAGREAEQLPIVESADGRMPESPEASPAWVSEAAADLYGWRPGSTVFVPLAGTTSPFIVHGIFRDYGRSSGAIVIARERYAALTSDVTANEASVWLEGGAEPVAVASSIRAVTGQGEGLQVRTGGEVRALSLRFFDRAFAVTYALEAIAVLIGLLGVGFAAASTALARRAEFGMLRHIGFLRRDVLKLLATEGLVTGAIGVAAALVIGGGVSLVLVYVVNRQSFLWSIDLAVPWALLALLTAFLVAAAAVASVAAGRAALNVDAVRAVREDW